MNDLYSVAVLLLLVVGLSLAAAHNAGVRIEFNGDRYAPSHSQTLDDRSQLGGSHADLPEHGHTHGHSGD